VSDLASSTESVTGRRSSSEARSTAQFGIIVFLASDVMLFAPFFAAYFLLRASNSPWPPPGVELDTLRASLATAVLVASSLTLVAADRAAERPSGGRSTQRWLLVTIGLGALFLANQAAEYATLSFEADDHPYGSIYWTLTGLHGLHVTAGVAALGLLFVRTVRAKASADVAAWSSGVSLFWHLVDLVWLGVFSTIWLMR